MSPSQAKLIAEKSNVGYWRVLDECFFSKTEALREASRKKTSIKYWYFDELFRAVHGEPISTVDELYNQRAKSIREKYEYVAIAASGGADSTNLIQAFLREGLYIDELITYYPVKTIEKLADAFDGSTAAQNMIFEYELAFKPLADKMKHASPGTKITVIDHSEEALKIVAGGTLNDVFHDISRTPNFIGALTLMRNFASADHKNACVVVGSDKPVVLVDTQTGQCFVIFDDFTNALLLANLNSGLAIEPFYFTKDAPSILQKQFFEIQRALKHHLKIGDIDAVISKRSIDARFRLLDMKHPVFEHAIYPSLWPIRFQAQKPMLTLFNESGTWLFHERFKNEVQTNLIDAWKGQIKEFVFGIDPRFIEYQGGLPVKFKPCPSSWFTFT